MLITLQKWLLDVAGHRKAAFSIRTGSRRASPELALRELPLACLPDWPVRLPRGQVLSWLSSVCMAQRGLSVWECCPCWRERRRLLSFIPVPVTAAWRPFQAGGHVSTDSFHHVLCLMLLITHVHTCTHTYTYTFSMWHLLMCLSTLFPSKNVRTPLGSPVVSCGPPG